MDHRITYRDLASVFGGVPPVNLTLDIKRYSTGELLPAVMVEVEVLDVPLNRFARPGDPVRFKVLFSLTPEDAERVADGLDAVVAEFRAWQREFDRRNGAANER